jgi:hypothetical protein
MLPKGDDDRFLLERQHRRLGILGASRDILDRTASFPLDDGLLVHPVALGQNPQALLTILYCSTASLLDDAPHLLRASHAVVLALPCKICPIVHPSIAGHMMHHQEPGLNS